MIAKIWKVLRKKSLIELILLKLQASSVYCTIKRLHHRFFLEDVKLAVLKEYFEKKSVVNQRFNKVAVL